MEEIPLYTQLSSYDNLFLAYKKARKGKTLRWDVIEFEKDLDNNLSLLRIELLLHTYQPKPLTTFILRDPKTRKISKSQFRDRVIHHALCNVIESLFEQSFIYDSYANRKGKGIFNALKRFGYFKWKVSKNYHQQAFCLKADIKHYFDKVNHAFLLQIIQRKIKDQKVIWLIQRILSNYSTKSGQGMPLGNLTSQFFANIYLNELDQFVKHQLKVKFYIRYVDDFIILHSSAKQLSAYQKNIAHFLRKHLALELHPTKSKIIPLQRGVDFLGMRIFHYHILLRNKNLRSFHRKSELLFEMYNAESLDYDIIYDFMEGWMAYARHANTYSFRRDTLLQFEHRFCHEISSKEVSRGRKGNKKP